MPTLCSTKLSLSPTPSQPHRRQGAPPMAHPGCRLGFGVPVSPLAPIPGTLGVFAHPWGMPLGHTGPREEGSVGPGVGVLLPTPGASPGEQGGPGRGSTAGSPPRWLPFQGSRSCWAAQRQERGWSRPGWRPDRAAPVGALGQGEDGPSRSADEVAAEWRAPGAQPTGARGQRSLPGALSPSCLLPVPAEPPLPYLLLPAPRLGCLPGPGVGPAAPRPPPRGASGGRPPVRSTGACSWAMGTAASGQGGSSRDEEGRLFMLHPV